MKKHKLNLLLATSLVPTLIPLIVSCSSNHKIDGDENNKEKDHIIINNVISTFSGNSIKIVISGENIHANSKFEIFDLNGEKIELDNLEIIVNQNGFIEITGILKPGVSVQNEMLQIQIKGENEEEAIKNFVVAPSITETSKSFANLNLFYQKELSRENRVANNEYYITDLQKRFGDKFRYMGWDYNYEASGNNKTLTLEDGSTKTYNDLVYSELAIGSDKRYSNGQWIQEQIKAGTFKRHPAHKTFYRADVTQETQSVTTQYQVGTSLMGPVSLGLYAPAGEVITLELDDRTFDLVSQTGTLPFNIIINHNYQDMSPTGYNRDSISTRYPYLESVFALDKESKTIKFGSPFGGGISIHINNKLLNPANKKIESVGFKVRGAVEQFKYIDGITTKNDWDGQIKRVRNNEITAPVFSGLSSNMAFQLPFSNIKEIGGVPLDQVVYPKEVFVKWFEFFWMSNYFYGNDMHLVDWKGKNVSARHAIKFNNDLWGGASGWGSQWYALVGVYAGGNAFLKGVDAFNTNENWLMFHEANHAYQLNEAFFNSRNHGETNNVSLVNLSVTSDTGRFRSLQNPTGEWTPDNWSNLTNSYAAVDFIKRRGIIKAQDNIYSLLLYLFGTKKYADYVRWDTYQNPEIRGGLGEIITLSQWSGYNLWPAIQYYGAKYNWRDGWPVSYEAATPEQKSQIDSIKNLPAIDFVGNIYASGIYEYDYETREFNYTNDVVPAFEIPAGEDYVFDFEKGINYFNPNFQWTTLEIPSTTKLGVSLKIDPSNSKKVIYTPDKNKLDQIDEFEMSIKGINSGYSDTYVPAYKWKVKIRQVANMPLVLDYGTIDSTKNMAHSIEEAKKRKPNAKFMAQGNYNVPLNANSLALFTFDFVAREAGTYKFDAAWDDQITLFIDGEQKFHQNWYSPSNKEIYSTTLEKNQIINFKVWTRNDGGAGYFRMNVYFENKWIPLSKNAILPNANEFYSGDVKDLLYLEKYQYKRRSLDFEEYNGISGANSTHINSMDLAPLDKSLYTFTSRYHNDADAALKHNDGYHFEVFNVFAPGNTTGKGALNEFVTDFKEEVTLSRIIIGHRTNNHYSQRATKIKIIVWDVDGKEIIAYDGSYPNRDAAYSDIEFAQTHYKITKLKVEAINEWNNGLVFSWVDFYENHRVRQGSIFASNNPLLRKEGDWSFQGNDIDINLSPINNIALLSSKTNDSLEFTLSNATYFMLSGKKGSNTSSFDIYINDKLVGTDVSTFSEIDLFDEKIFDFANPTKNTLKIKIVNKEDKPLFINYISTGGVNTKLS